MPYRSPWGVMSSARFLAGDVGGDECPQSGGINIGNTAQIKDHGGEALFAPNRILKQKDILHSQRPPKTKHALTFNISQSFDVKPVSHASSSFLVWPRTTFQFCYPVQ